MQKSGLLKNQRLYTKLSTLSTIEQDKQGRDKFCQGRTNVLLYLMFFFFQVQIMTNI